MQALRLDPRCPEPFYFVGLALKERGAFQDAIACLEHAIRLAPGHAAARNDLGVTYLQAHRLDEARACFEQVGGALGLANLAQVCRDQGLWERAAAHLHDAIALNPADPVLWSNLACFLQESNHLVDAMECAERALSLSPNSAEAWTALGNVRCRLGRHEEAAHAFDRAAALPAGLLEFQQNRLFMRHYCGGITPARHAEEHRRWAAPFNSAAPPRRFANVPDPARKLRIGYVSGDFRAHPVSYFLAPVLEAHDPNGIVTVCYASGTKDAWTARMRAAATLWRDAGALDDGVPLSVLDLAPIAAGSTVTQALRNTVDLAQAAERAATGATGWPSTTSTRVWRARPRRC